MTFIEMRLIGCYFLCYDLSFNMQIYITFEYNQIKCSAFLIYLTNYNIIRARKQFYTTFSL